MVASSRAVVLAAALSAQSVTLGSAPLAGQSGVTVRDTLLENGLHVIVMPNHNAPVVTLEVVIRAGAFTQVAPEEEGLPHILEHMLFTAYGGRGWGSYAADAGATYNGTTGDEQVTYFVTMPSENAEDGMELLGNLFREPSFDGREFENELRVVRGELERRTSDPYYLLLRDHEMSLWGSAFQRKNAIGNASTIMATTARGLDAHYRRFYVPNNAALIVSGDIDVEDAFDWAHDRFRRWKTGEDPFTDFEPPRIEALTDDVVGVVDAEGSDVTIRIGWHGPSVREDPRGTHAADVFSEILGMPTSGLQRRLVDTGLFQAVDIGYLTLQHVGPISLVARTSPAQLSEALEALAHEFDVLRSGDFFDEGNLAAAKRRLRVRRALGRESTPSAAHGLASFWSVADLDYWLGYESALESVTSADVQAFLERYVIDRPMAVSALGTSAARLSLEEELPAAVKTWRAGG